MNVGVTACHLRPKMAKIPLDEVVRHTQIDHACSNGVAELMGLKAEELAIRVSYLVFVS